MTRAALEKNDSAFQDPKGERVATFLLFVRMSSPFILIFCSPEIVESFIYFGGRERKGSSLAVEAVESSARHHSR